MIGHMLMGTCSATAASMSAYADGDLRALRRFRVAAHLRRCERCRAIYRSLLATIDLLRAAAGPEPDPRPELAERVVARIRAESGPG